MSFLSLLTALGVEDVDDRGGKEIPARCPRHELRTGQREARPRHWSINRYSGVWHCFSCDDSGNLLQLVMDLTGWGLWDAHRFIREHDVNTNSPGEATVDFSRLPSLKVIQNLQPEYDAFTDPPDRALRRRRISLEACRDFGVRWEQGQPLGTWILPIRSPRTGSLWGWQRKKGQNVENHPTGVKKGLTLFGLDQFREGSLAVLVESPLDALVLSEHGYHGLASFGAAVSHEQLRLIRQRTDRLILFLDNDRAGRDATYRLLCDRTVPFARLWVASYHHSPEAKDVGEMTGDEIEVALETARSATQWIVNPSA